MLFYTLRLRLRPKGVILSERNRTCPYAGCQEGGVLLALNIDKEVFARLSESEQRVVQYLDANQDRLENISITMVANKTFTSPATVSRAISKIGYSGGIAQLRYDMSQKFHQEDTELRQMRNVNKVLAKSYRECTRTIDNMVVTDILKVTHDIKQANRIFILALGTSALIAKIFQEQLIILGYTPVLIDDTVWMKKANFHMNEEDLVLVLTERCTENVLYYASARAKKQGAKLVTCTCKKETELVRISDTVIYGHSEQTVDGYMPHASRIPLMIITRTIVEYLAQ